MTGRGTLADDLCIIIIGRNEGERLVKCLQSVRQTGARMVYVDSGSTDGSVLAAETAGAQVIALDMSIPFTAARARNAGLQALGLYPQCTDETSPVSPEFIQFIDGDCEIHPQWLDAATAFLRLTPNAGVVFGRLRERYPEVSPYNALCDAEWDTPLGQTTACGGIAMMRRVALAQTSLFNAEMIAGEEPELCLRLARKGWQIWRIAEEMALHDAAMLRLGQFWKRMRRGGFAYALWVHMHGKAPERLGVPAWWRTVIWGGLIPVAIVVLAVVWGPAALALVVVYPLQIARLALREGGKVPAWRKAGLLTVGKFAEMQGILEYHLWRGLRRPARIIEHK